MRFVGQRALKLPERLALIALGGVCLSVAVWFLHAFVDGVLFSGFAFAEALFAPDTAAIWSRLVAILAVLAGTVTAQTLYARRVQADYALDVEQERTRLSYEHSPNAVVCMNPDLTVTYANGRAAALAGLPADELTGRPCHEALLGAPVPCHGCEIADVVRTATVSTRTFQVGTRTGCTVWIECVQYPVLDSDGTVDSVVEIARDVTAVKLAEDEISRALRDSQERHRTLVDHSPDMIVVAEDGRISFVNPAGVQFLGLDTPSPVFGRPVTELFAPGGAETTPAELELAIVSGLFSRPMPVKLLRPDGYRIDVELTGTRMMLDGSRVVQYVARDITERLDAENTIRTMAFYDPLTELPNRTLFNDRLRAAIAHARRVGTTVAVAFLDLDEFKLINDTLSHVVGDELLCLVGQRIRETVRDGDTVARMSGDEFTVVAHLTYKTDAASFAQRLLDAFAMPFRVREHLLHITASIGVAVFPDHGIEPSDLIKNADTAMYCAKDARCNSFRVYEPAMGARSLDRLLLERELRDAFDAENFQLRYQPQVDTRNGSIVGVEALLRWHHPERGELAPDTFLAVAEQSGLMTQIGRWVLEKACERAQGWRQQGLDFGRMAVNLSARELHQLNVVDVVADALGRTGLEPSLLEIEITENTALYEVDRVLDTLNELRSLGVRIAIDDFGTGYSSLSYLKRFPVQTLKIAQTFMSDVHRDQHSAGIARMMVDLCRLLELDMVAEGVDHPDQLRFLTDHGCHVVQGHLFSKALRPEEIESLLASGGRLRAGVI